MIELKCKEIELGKGMVDVAHFTMDGRHGVLLKPRKKHIEIGSDNMEVKNSIYHPSEDDVVIWIDKIESGEVLSNIVELVNKYVTGELLHVPLKGSDNG